MSFILDALKKSESDRQRQSGPSLFEVKVAPPRRALPLWAMAIAVLLGINVIVVSWMLLRHPAAQQQAGAGTAPAALQPERVPAAGYSGVGAVPLAAGSGQVPYAARSGPSSGGSLAPATAGGAASAGPSGSAPSGAAPPGATPPGAAPAAAAAFGPATAGAGASTEPQLPAAARSPEVDRATSAFPRAADSAMPRGGADDATASRAAQGADREDAGNDAPAVQPAAGSGESGGTGDLPLYQQIVSNAGLPALHLDLHVFAGRPQDRFVMINMHRLGEGDSLPNGVQVDAIRPDGVVLSYHGTRFLLPRN